ncbi:MAG: hypothetical protein H6706_28760 [Myxococcales bacterium]|nr:hypothetical protein [Myxococcales bacterium]
MAGLPPRPPGYLPDGSPRWVRTFVIAELVGRRGGHVPPPRRGPRPLPTPPRPPPEE